MIGKTISHFKIIEKIGAGGMGEVYLSKDTRLDRKVALKFLPAQLTTDTVVLARFEREAKATAALNHPNIVTVYEIGDHENQTFIAMEYVDGQSLRERMEKEIPQGEVMDLVTQICEGIGKAHEADVVHRDIKPENIMIDKDGRVRILDFGLAKLKGVTKLTSEASTLGTLNYMSPEQFQALEVDHRTDIWSIGVILYEMIMGVLPFEGDYEAAVIYSLLNEDVASITSPRFEVSDQLEQIVIKALVKNPDERYQNTKEMLEDLRQLTEHSEAKDSTLKEAPAKKSSTKRAKYLLFSGIGLSLVLLVLAIYFVLFRYLPPGKTTSRDSLVEDVPSIAVMYFEDVSGDEQMKWLSRGLPHMLITNLEQSPNLHVIGYQRLYDLLNEIGKKGQASIDRTTATAIARRAGVKTMLLGSILKWENRIRIDYQLQDVKEGTLLRADKVTGEDPFALADELALQVRHELEVASLGTQSQKVADITTHSLDAYRYYLLGKDFYDRGNWKGASDNYSMAISIDSTFAMAYMGLWDIGVYAGGTFTEAEAMLTKAVQYSSQTSEREQLLILSEEAYFHKKLRKFRVIIEELIQKYPNYPAAYEKLGTFHRVRGESKLALSYWRKLADLNPSTLSFDYLISAFTEIGWHDSVRYYTEKHAERFPNDPSVPMTRAQLYLRDEDFDKFLLAAQQVVTLGPEEAWTHNFLGEAYLFVGKYDGAVAEYRQLDALGWPWLTSRKLALVEIYQGKYASALDILQEKGNSGPRRAESTLYWLNGQKEKAGEFWLASDLDLYYGIGGAAKRGADGFVADSLLRTAIPREHYKENIKEALDLCDRAVDEIVQKDLGGSYMQVLLANRAEILHSVGRYSEAAEVYETLVKEDPRTFYNYRLADCYYREKRHLDAREMLLQVKFSNEYLGWIGIYFAYSYPKSIYLLGLVHEALGERAEAVKAYQRFLELWKNADKDLPELSDAKSRLAELQ